MTTPTDHILTLAQWFSPSFPIGAFAYSHGLESAVDTDDVQSGSDLREWITIVLDSGAGRSDAIFLAAAFKAPDQETVEGIDVKNRAFCATKERLFETDRQGEAFCKTIAVLNGGGTAGLTYPVAVGFAAQTNSLPLQMCASMYLHAFASNLVGAGMRLLPVGQSEGQKMIMALAPLCEEIARETMHGDLDQLSGTAFLAEISAMRHETQHSRIFRT